MPPSRQHKYDLAMPVTSILALYFAYPLKSSKYLCKDSNGSRGVALGSIVASKPREYLPGKRLTRQGVAANSLGTASVPGV